MTEYIETLPLELPEQFTVINVNHFAGNAFISKNGKWRIDAGNLPVSNMFTSSKARILFKEKNSIVCSHELAHIGEALPFIGRFKRNSLLIHIDGLASDSNMSVYFYDDTLKYVYHGWEALEVAQIFGFNDFLCECLGINERQRLSLPGKLMGYAAYGESRDDILSWLRENDWFMNIWKSDINVIEEINKKFGCQLKKYDLSEEIYMNIAATCQKELERVVLKLIAKFKKKTNAQNLVFSGGVALNIMLNKKLVDSGLFEDVFVPPCCSDMGLSLGAVYMINFLNGGKIERKSPFLNSIGLEDELKEYKFDCSEQVVNKIVERLVAEKIIGTCIGKGECGPRALGHRSILAIPTNKEMYERVSLKIKGREWYRPVAPITIDSIAEKVFEIPSSKMAKYMLINCGVRKEWRKRIPAVVHCNGSARVQIISRDDKELRLIYLVIEKLWEKYKIPCLINTSFNYAGEPIVHTIEDAKKAAVKMKLDCLIINNSIIDY